MAKQSGLGQNLYVGGYDLSGDMGALNNVSGKKSLLDVTGIDKLAFERIGGLRDGEMGFANVFFNPDDDHEHEVLSALPTSDVLAMLFTALALGAPVASIVGKQIDYDWNRAQDGALLGTVQVLANGNGLEWCTALTAGKRTDTAATNGSSVDDISDTGLYGTSTNFGWAAYLSVLDFQGTDITIKLQDSADNSSFSNVTGGAFTQVTAGQVSERIQGSLSATLRRYPRIATTTSGGFTSCTFAVALIRYLTKRDQ